MAPTYSLTYRLLEPIGWGGMGTAWRAEDRLLRRQAAIAQGRATRGLDPKKCGDPLIPRPTGTGTSTIPGTEYDTAHRA